LLHAWLLKLQMWQGTGLVLGLEQSFSLFTWQCALLLCVFLLRQPLQHLGPILYPLAAIGAVIGNLGMDDAAVALSAAWTIQLHVLLSLLAYGVLTIAAVQAVTLAVQDHQLHRREVTAFTRSLPPLQAMEELLFSLIAIGLFLLSLALLSGFFFVENLLAQHLVHKTVLSILAWLFFAVLLWGRWRSGWRGRVAVRWTLGAYAVLLLAYFGSKFVLEAVLGKHW
jgi:ABC-type uncharacterized transport system permease subunit